MQRLKSLDLRGTSRFLARIKELFPWSNNAPADRKGAMLVLICAMIFAFLVTVAFSVDIAYMHLVKSELRSATDAAAKAATEALARTQDSRAALDRGKEIARANLVANVPLDLRDSDFTFGRATLIADGSFQFQAGGFPTNSVRVKGLRTNNSLSGNVQLFFGRIFNTGSFQPQETSTATFIERDIVLVVDRSGSMLDDNKFVSLTNAISVFTRILNDSPVEERVGLASYSTFESEDVDLTTDLNAINEGMSNMLVAGFTNISGGIDAGGRIMARGRTRPFVERTMILLTDGMQNVGRPAVQAARQEAAKGTTIHSITFGRGADQSAMTQVARVGGGRFFHADDGADLERVFREIALTLSTILTQ